MKRFGIFLISALLMSSFAWRCTKDNESYKQQDIKESINASIQKVNTAVDAITSSAGYKNVLSNSAFYLKSGAADSLYNIIISLQDISGIYDYQLVSSDKKWHQPISNFFKKTGESEQLLVRLPREKVNKPRSLGRFTAGDSSLVNNFQILVTDYTYKISDKFMYDYKLAAGIKDNDVDAGSLWIASSADETNGFKYSAGYSFGNGYSAKMQAFSGDTAISGYSILEGENIVYEERLVSMKTDASKFHREREYTLIIGDFKLVRNSNLDSLQVYLKDQLQKNAKIEIVDASTDTQNASIFKKRDLKITFDDGTSSSISQLAGNAIPKIAELFTSLRQINFSSEIVDWIAIDIYMNKNNTASAK